MSVEDLQQFIFKKSNEIRNRGTFNGNEHPEYKRALKEIVDELNEEREMLIKSYEVLKKYNLK